MVGTQDQIDKAARLADAGFYIALHAGFSFARQEYNRLPPLWVEYYTVRGLFVHDPVMRWFYGNSGVTRWSSIALADPMGVIPAAAEYGLTNGASVSILGEAGHRSYASFFRKSKPFSDFEILQLYEIVKNLHHGDTAEVPLTPAEVEALRLQSEGMRLKQIAWELGISVSAVKARLSNAKRKLGAQTSSQAAIMASAKGIF